jgi:hypothetical protein
MTKTSKKQKPVNRKANPPGMLASRHTRPHNGSNLMGGIKDKPVTTSWHSLLPVLLYALPPISFPHDDEGEEEEEGDRHPHTRRNKIPHIDKSKCNDEYDFCLSALTKSMPTLHGNEQVPSKDEPDTCSSSGMNLSINYMLETFLSFISGPPYSLAVSLTAPSMLCSKHPLAFIVDCSLSRAHKKPRAKNECMFTETVYRVRCKPQYTTDSYDHLFRTIIVIVPYASVFITNSRTFTKSNGPAILPISWLRLDERSGAPAKGSYIKTLQRSWQVNRISIPLQNVTQVMACYQFDDACISTPILCPDVFPCGDTYADKASRRLEYRCLLEQSPSNRFGCRRYVKGWYHRDIPDSCYIYDFDLESDTVIRVTVLDLFFRPYCHSVVKVACVEGFPSLISELNLVTDSLMSSGVVSNCRSFAGDHGSMVAFGIVADHCGREVFESKSIKKYPKISDHLSRMCKSSRLFCDEKYPGLSRVIRGMEESASILPPEYLGGVSGVSSQVMVSIDYMNTSHYDVNDASVGYFIAQETHPGKTRNWYFILPNVLIKRNGTTYEGLAIKLKHGLSVMWDGRVIRHCTSKHWHTQQDGHTLGYWFGAGSRPIHTVLNNQN